MDIIVRCLDKMVFKVNPETFEAKTCSYYDAYCFSDPLRDAVYIDYHDWICLRSDQRAKRAI